MENKVIEFVRKKDFQLVQELGQGGFGKAVLLYDTEIQEHFVCKKYSPLHPEHKEDFYKNFVQEIKFLYTVNHPNIVRLFSYYLYPEVHTGFIMMEYVKGQDIEEHIKQYPENINRLFVQAIEGFSYLERNSVLHRDIRFQNIMIGDNAALKIIDFGFGKKALKSVDFDKSISLNWQFEPPAEFKDNIYDFQTEVYFVGKLFERLIADNNIEDFQYKPLLSSMCRKEPSARAGSFADIRSGLLTSDSTKTGFNNHEKQTYRNFADCLTSIVASIEKGAKYFDDIDRILLKLEELHQSVMLEESLPDVATLPRCFISGTYTYIKSAQVEVSTIEDFIKLLRGSTKEKKNIVLRNIHSRLESIKRYERQLDDEVPF